MESTWCPAELKAPVQERKLPMQAFKGFPRFPEDSARRNIRRDAREPQYDGVGNGKAPRKEATEKRKKEARKSSGSFSKEDRQAKERTRCLNHASVLLCLRAAHARI